MQLNEKQSYAMKQVALGKNVFISGPGGVGKSVVTRRILEQFSDSTVLVAPTGIAALNIGGATIHRTFLFPTNVLTSYHAKNFKPLTGSLFSVDGPVRRIVIDEISMTRADTFIAMDHTLRHIRRKNMPFGGLQVIVVGDFYQLPPVLTDNDKPKFHEVNQSEFCFATESWSSAGFEYIELDQIMRQSDQDFITHLQAVRRAASDRISDAIDFFNSRSELNKPYIYDAYDPVFLSTTNKNADIVNQEHYSQLSGEEHTYVASYSSDMKIHPVSVNLNLKFGTKVMFCANTDDYKNGEIGFVTGFPTRDSVEVTKDNNNEDTVIVREYKWNEIEYTNSNGELIKKAAGYFKQLPLKHAWGITIHKSQGLTLPSAVIDFGRNCFASGQAYVALSRVKNIDGFFLQRPFKKSDIIVAPEIKEFYENGAKGIGLF